MAATTAALKPDVLPSQLSHVEIPTHRRYDTPPISIEKSSSQPSTPRGDDESPTPTKSEVAARPPVSALTGKMGDNKPAYRRQDALPSRRKRSPIPIRFRSDKEVADPATPGPSRRNADTTYPSRLTEITDAWRSGSHASSDYQSAMPSSNSSAPPKQGSSIDAEDEVTVKNRKFFPPLAPGTGPAGISRWPRDREQSLIQERVIAAEVAQLDLEIHEADTSSAASSDDGSDLRLPVLWSKLQSQREKNKDLRTEMLELRKEIQDLRRRKDLADNDFMRLVRPTLVDETSYRVPRPNPQLLVKHFHTMQTVRTDYNDAEARYEQLENQLDTEDNELQVRETEFWSSLYRNRSQSPAPKPSPTASEAELKLPPSRTSLLGIDGDLPDDIHPLYSDLLSAVGDRQEANEHLVELICHRDSVLYDLESKLKLDRSRDNTGEARWDSNFSEEDLDSLKLTASSARGLDLDTLRTRFGWAIPEHELEFLDQFELDERAAVVKYDEMKTEVDRLRRLCMEKDVMRKNPPVSEMFSIWYAGTEDWEPPENITITPDDQSAANGLANPHYPILLSNPKHVLKPDPLTAKAALKEATKLPKDDQKRTQQVADAVKEYNITTLIGGVEAENKSDYINRWLLHRLRISPLEADLLYSVFSSVLKVKNARRWQEDVLYFWPRDAANTSPDIYDGPVTSRDTLQLDDLDQANVNREILLPSRPASEDPNEKARPHPSSPARPHSEPGWSSSRRNNPHASSLVYDL